MSVPVLSLVLMFSLAVLPASADPSSDETNSKTNQTSKSSQTDDIAGGLAEGSIMGGSGSDMLSGRDAMIGPETGPGYGTDFGGIPPDYAIGAHIGQSIDEAVKKAAAGVPDSPLTKNTQKQTVVLSETAAEPVAEAMTNAMSAGFGLSHPGIMVSPLLVAGILNEKSLTQIADQVQDKTLSAQKSSPETDAQPAGPSKKPAAAYLPPPVVDAFVARNPSNPWGNYAQGVQKSLSGDHQAAYKSLSKAIKLGKDDAETRVPHATAANAIGRPADALHSARKVLSTDPYNEGAKAQEMFARRRLAEAGIDEASLNDQFKPKRKEDLYESEGKDDLLATEDEQTEAFARSAGESNKLAIEAHQALRRGDSEGAIKLVREATQRDPENIRAMNIGARAFNQLKRYQNTLAITDTALELAPGNKESLMHRSFAESAVGDFAGGKESALALLRSQPKNALGFQLLARAQAGLGDREGMLKTLSVGATLNPVLERQYKRALEMPEDEDASLLFSDGVITAAAEAPGRSGRRISKGTLAVSGLALFALFGLFGLKRSQSQPQVDGGGLSTEARQTLLADETPSAASHDETPSEKV